MGRPKGEKKDGPEAGSLRSRSSGPSNAVAKRARKSPARFSPSLTSAQPDALEDLAATLAAPGSVAPDNATRATSRRHTIAPPSMPANETTLSPAGEADVGGSTGALPALPPGSTGDGPPPVLTRKEARREKGKGSGIRPAVPTAGMRRKREQTPLPVYMDFGGPQWSRGMPGQVRR
jgi:hypothetical protein